MMKSFAPNRSLVKSSSPTIPSDNGGLVPPVLIGAYPEAIYVTAFLDSSTMSVCNPELFNGDLTCAAVLTSSGCTEDKDRLPNTKSSKFLSDMPHIKSKFSS